MNDYEESLQRSVEKAHKVKTMKNTPEWGPIEKYLSNLIKFSTEKLLEATEMPEIYKHQAEIKAAKSIYQFIDSVLAGEKYAEEQLIEIGGN